MPGHGILRPKEETIVQRLKKRLRTDTRLEVVIVTKNTVVQETNQDPVFLASITVATAQANASNVGKLVENVEHYKERKGNMKNTLVQ